MSHDDPTPPAKRAVKAWPDLLPTDAAAADPSRRRVVFRTLRLLIVDDDAVARGLVRGLLDSFGVRVIVEARDALAALNRLEEHTIDLMLVSQEMARIDGVALARRVRTGMAGDDTVPIVLMAQAGDDRAVLAARDAGVNAFMVKPFTAQALYLRIHHTLAHPRPFLRLPDYIGPERREGANFRPPQERRTRRRDSET